MASLWTKFTDIFSRTKSGVVPQAPNGSGTTKYLCEDGTWKVPSGSGGGGTAADISYDGTQSGLSAETVQEAIDELADGYDLPLTVVDGKLCIIYEEV